MNPLAKIPTPLEVVDLGADVVNQVFSAPFRVGANVSQAATASLGNLKADIARPREYSAIPPPPDVLVEPAFTGIGHILEGALGMAKGALDGVVETVDGIRRDVDTRIKR